jgi:hypothetical protein
MSQYSGNPLLVPQGTQERRGNPSTWYPLRQRLFRALWLATVVSNIGTWMQNVGRHGLWLLSPHRQ